MAHWPIQGIQTIAKFYFNNFKEEFDSGMKWDQQVINSISSKMINQNFRILIVEYYSKGIGM